ncbi:unnamed protein product, partial [Linum tenue]
QLEGCGNPEDRPPKVSAAPLRLLAPSRKTITWVPDGSSDGVAPSKEKLNDPGGDEPAGAGDTNGLPMAAGGR